MSGLELKPCPFCGGEWRRGPYDVHCYGTEFNRHTMIVLRYDEANRRTPDPAQIRADALREAADCLRGLAYGTGVRTIRALLATPPSPTAVDGSAAPDAGGKECV